MAEQQELYCESPVIPPSMEVVAELSKKLNLRCTQEEVIAIKDFIEEKISKTYKVVDRMKTKTLPVKYPRTTGYQPIPEDNTFNAWTYKCIIEGSASGKLRGKHIALKDSIALAGVPMRVGSLVLQGYVPEFDATVVTRILDAGGCIMGKTTCEDMCFSGNSFTSRTGVVFNPHDNERSAGGSSSGNGVLLANGEIEMSIGGDQGGSIRTPASWCGIVGLKPTFGLVPYTGAMSGEPTIDHLGPMTNNVENCALLLEVIAGYDFGLDPRQRNDIKIPEYTKELTKGINGKRIAVVHEGFENCESDVVSCVKDAAESLAQKGAIVEEISIPLHKDGQNICTVATLEGTYYSMLDGNGTGSSWRGFYPLSLQEAVAKGISTRPYDLPFNAKMAYMFGKYMHDNYHHKYISKGMNACLLLKEAYDDVLKEYDVLVMPTTPFKAQKLPTVDASLQERMGATFGMTKNTCPFNVTGHPAISINTGYSDGLPVGMMIIGRHFDETTVLQVAYAYENLRDKTKAQAAQ